MTTITFTTHRSKVSTRTMSRCTLVSEQTVETEVIPTDAALAEHLGDMPAGTGWVEYATRREAQFTRREGSYDYNTTVSISR